MYTKASSDVMFLQRQPDWWVTVQCLKSRHFSGGIMTPESESNCWSQHIYHTRLWVLFCLSCQPCFFFFFTCFAEYMLVKRALKRNTNVFDGSCCLFLVKKTLCLESTETLSLGSFLIGGFLSNNCFQSCIFSLRGWHEKKMKINFLCL